MSLLTPTLIDWLKANADEIDQSNALADELFAQVAASGIFKYGVPTAFGGDGEPIQKAVDAITELATYSLTAAFISWGHRTFIEHILASDNPAPRENWLADLLSGKLSAGTGLSNAVKFLSGVEELNVTIREENGKRYLNGRLPWVTNLSKNGFVNTFVAGFEQSEKSPLVLAVPSTVAGVSRSDELALVALQGSNTVAVNFDNVELQDDWILSDNASQFLAQTRPEFLGLQCGLPFGLAQRSLAEVEKSLTFGSNRLVLQPEWEAQVNALNRLKQQLQAGLANKSTFIDNPKSLFQIRIDIVDVVAQSVLLELQAGGGRGYLKNAGSDFIRRWREAAFLPVVTPSAVQLRLVLAK